MLTDLAPYSAQAVPEPRKQYKALGPRTKWWIKWLRIAQICWRVLQLVAAAGILFLMIIIDNVNPLTAWVLRITVCPTIHGSHGCRPNTNGLTTGRSYHAALRIWHLPS